MKVTPDTIYNEYFAELEQVLKPESAQALKEAAEQAYKPCHMLTIDEFWGCLSRDYSILGDLSEPTVLQVYWLKRFAEFADELAKTCERLTIKENDESTIMSGIKTSPQETMLLFVRNYFGLGSFEEAGKRTIGEYVLARKDAYNKRIVQRNQEALMARKYKKK